jgi:trimethylamine:corrinoid methyltransferase-like protein
MMKPLIQFLSDQEVRLLHEQSLLVLKEIGMRLPHEEALELMSQNGAEIVDENVVRIPTRLELMRLSGRRRIRKLIIPNPDKLSRSQRSVNPDLSWN